MSDYFEDKLATFDQALKTFKESLLDAPSQLERDGAIQRFEYCYDLSWKTLKQYLQRRGIVDLNSPKSVFNAAYTEKVIDDESTWSTIITKRNLSVHTYNQKLADSLFSELPEYYNAMLTLLKAMVD
ncbi:MAG: nucleotidyltransferase substrate binding protein like protein [Mucilaginibacter sp.]|uniref:HI0074 family nucleotidyltransferase substrate-binding subunit n=1 Tax=Mucilaginibacter sp. TaxID=1882438 RepID=UPI00262D834B|nr:HI0074 family nucleotidyltransferase substrate-binding subunit [Mucilaginibacter sp.]MDB5002945.1 nucleotidyltransferase substrate binding protein like protein [Mucilaginibacter sp.]